MQHTVKALQGTKCTLAKDPSKPAAHSPCQGANSAAHVAACHDFCQSYVPQLGSSVPSKQAGCEGYPGGWGRTNRLWEWWGLARAKLCSRSCMHSASNTYTPSCKPDSQRNTPPPLQQHIGGLDVEVHDAAGVQIDQSLGNMQCNLHLSQVARQAEIGQGAQRVHSRMQEVVAMSPLEAPLAPHCTCASHGACAHTFLPFRYQLTFLAARFCVRLPPSMYSVTSTSRLSSTHAPCRRARQDMKACHKHRQSNRTGLVTAKATAESS